MKRVQETKLVSEIKLVQVELKDKVEAPVAAKTYKPEPTTT